MIPDMDLVVLIDDPEAALDPSTFVAMIGDLLERVSDPPVVGEGKARDSDTRDRRPTLTSSRCQRRASRSSSSTSLPLPVFLSVSSGARVTWVTAWQPLTFRHRM